MYLFTKNVACVHFWIDRSSSSSVRAWAWMLFLHQVLMLRLCRIRESTKYEILCVINQVSLGTVYKARNQKTGEFVAVKQELTGKSPSTEREIDIIGSLPEDHPSFVQLKDLTMDDQRRVFVVTEYMEDDLKKLIDSRPPSTLSDVKFLMKRLLEGVAFLHDKGIMHRDIKPSNILVNTMQGKLKICEFGLSRELWSKQEPGWYTPGVGSLWYKAPEVLLGDRYSCAVDMWSVGCIMAELLLNRVLFKGNECDFGQLYEIFTILGRPNDVTYPGFSSLTESGFFLQMDEGSSMLRTEFDEARLQLTERGFDLLERFLDYDPKKRITAREALNHGWFREYYGITTD